MNDLVYKIFDSKAGEYWSNHLYLTAGVAKAAMSRTWSRPLNYVKFDDQERYVIHTFKLEMVG